MWRKTELYASLEKQCSSGGTLVFIEIKDREGEERLVEQDLQAQWRILCDSVADQMKVFTRPFVTILAGGAAWRCCRTDDF